MTYGRLVGRRIQVAGSASSSCEPQKLRYAHALVSSITNQSAKVGAGFVVTVGSEPTHPTNPELPIIFDWTVLESFERAFEKGGLWPEPLGAPIVAVGLPKWQEKIPEDRRDLWERLVRTRSVELVQIPAGLSIGGVLRQFQSRFGDILVPIGGGPGVEHLAGLYYANHRAIVPLDLAMQDYGGELRGGERLYKSAIANPTRFFEFESSQDAAASLSLLSVRRMPASDDFGIEFCNFISRLSRPRAFFVRLLNREVSEFQEVDTFFRSIVEPVIQASGYRRFESGRDITAEALLNVEIFEMLHSCSLVVADMTGLRPNCLLELGYALGSQKKIILTAKKQTKLPFDSFALPCFFWSPTAPIEDCKQAFSAFMSKNMNRGAIVKESPVAL